MKNHSSPLYSFQQFNEEINDFYKYLKDNKYTDEEIRKIFAPLLPTANFKITKRAVFISTLMTVLLILYFATYMESLSWHLSAIGRILLIKVLPFWDWTSLKNERCLIQKPTSSTFEEIRFNCDLCENLQQIDVYEEISEEFLKTRYLDVDTPVIIKKSFPRPNFFLEDLLQNQIIASSNPCKLATNINDGISTIKNLFSKTHFFDNFFLHFQNCDFEVMKQFRQYAPRPFFLPAELSPVQYNWLLWSRNYNTTQFKRIGLVDKVALVWQAVGANFVKLVPRGNCEGECPVIEVKLAANEAIVFTNLWNFEYLGDFGENVAVVLELH